jgi:UDP-N-acetylglucosamine 2-epimerase (non-hydrolysing)
MFSLSNPVNLGLDIEDFCLVIFHRVENIFLKKRISFVIELIDKISSNIPVVFVQHQATINQLKRFGLWEKLERKKNIYYFKILSHAQFINLLNRSKFVITDGGSIQEEAFYLGKPCLLLRRYTERKEGLGENVILSRFDKEKIDYFLNHPLEFIRKNRVSKEGSASSVIVDSLKKYA